MSEPKYRIVLNNETGFYIAEELVNEDLDTWTAIPDVQSSLSLMINESYLQSWIE